MEENGVKPQMKNYWTPDVDFGTLLSAIHTHWGLLFRVITFFREIEMEPDEAAEAIRIPAPQLLGIANNPTSLGVSAEIELGWNAAQFCVDCKRTCTKSRLRIIEENVFEAAVPYRWERMVDVRRKKAVRRKKLPGQTKGRDARQTLREYHTSVIFSRPNERIQVHASDFRRELENPELTTEVMNNILTALHVPSEACRYTDMFYKFAFILRAKSLKCYELLRRVLPFPTTANVHRRFHDDFLATAKELGDPQEVPQRVNSFLSSVNYEGMIHASLLMDAAALAVFRKQRFDTIPGGESSKVREAYKNVVDDQRNFFVLLLAPTHFELPTVVLHIWPSTDGHVHQDTLTLIHDIVPHCNVDDRLRTNFLITDGDTGTNSLHNDAFEKVISSKNIHEMMDIAKHDTLWPMTDILHAAKCGRSRIVHHVVGLGDPVIGSFNGDKLEPMLRLGKALLDKSSIAKMRDKYALQIFSLQNYVTLTDKEPVAGLYVLVWALILSVFRHTHLSMPVRLYCLDLAFSFLLHIMRSLEGAVEGFVQKSPLKNSSKTFTFFDSLTVKRLINTLVGVRTILCSGEQLIGMHRLTTQNVENLFGNYREGCFHYYTFDSATRWITRSVMTAREMEAIHLRSPIRTRDSLGGTRINQRDAQGSSLIEHLPVPYIDPWRAGELYFAATIQHYCLLPDSPLYKIRINVRDWIRRILQSGDFTDTVAVTDKTTDSGLNGTSILARYISHKQVTGP